MIIKIFRQSGASSPISSKMLTKEFRILLPLTLEEYRLAHPYVADRRTRELGPANVTVLANEPYTNGPAGPDGVPTDGHFAHRYYTIKGDFKQRNV